MDIPFEKVSVKEAQHALAEHDAEVAPAMKPKDWSAKRQALDAEQIRINKDVLAWLEQLPPEVRPKELAIQYPRIFNKIVELWRRPLLCEKYLDELLMDERGTRKGFPEDVATELTVLKNHFLVHAKTLHFGVWGERIGE